MTPKTEVAKKPPSKFEMLMRWRGRQLLKAKTLDARRKVFLQLMAECAVHLVHKTPPKHKHPTILDNISAFLGEKLSDDIGAHLKSRTVADWMTLKDDFPLEAIWGEYEPLIKKMLSEPEGSDNSTFLEDPE